MGVLAVAATSLADAGCRVVSGRCGNMHWGLWQVPLLAKDGQSGSRSERPLCSGGWSKGQSGLSQFPLPSHRWQVLRLYCFGLRCTEAAATSLRVGSNSHSVARF